LRQKYSVLYEPSLVDDCAALARAVLDARALIVRNRTRVTAALIAVAPKLECIGRLGVGLDNIDLDACAARNITVYPATGANDAGVAEYVIATTMLLMRGAYLSTAAMIDGKWPRQQLMGDEIAGKVMGLVGFGSIARQVASRARALGMTIIATDPHIPADDSAWHDVKRAEPGDLLKTADVVSLHIPLTPQTRNIIDAKALASMKPGAILINAARGGVLDEQALAEALKSGHLDGAALDVFETEPLTATAAEKFKTCKNLILTPHIAGLTRQSNARVSALTVENVARHLAG
jgi:(S)-sulfolactate dehydrogenase